MLGKVPQTIEDAITFTKDLGKRYIWAYSLCIDEKNDADKLQQIRKMWSVYRGSYATIIGMSADSGLPRLGSTRQMFRQLSCAVDGKQLVGLMPILTQLTWASPWGSRAWTLQEALMSPRCLYVSDHRLCFKCNSMQYCESLNQTRSWAHNLRHGSFPARQRWIAAQLGVGCLKNPIDEPSVRLVHYGARCHCAATGQ